MFLPFDLVCRSVTRQIKGKLSSKLTRWPKNKCNSHLTALGHNKQNSHTVSSCFLTKNMLSANQLSLRSASSKCITPWWCHQWDWYLTQANANNPTWSMLGFLLVTNCVMSPGFETKISKWVQYGAYKVSSPNFETFRRKSNCDQKVDPFKWKSLL